MRRNILNRGCVYNASIFVSRILPLAFLRVVSKSVAFLNYLFFGEARANVKRNLAHVYQDPRKIKRLTRKIFLNYGGYVADWAKLVHMDTKEVLDWFSFYKGKEHIEEGLRRGKGVILLTAHLGNWELGGLFLSHSGFPINVITAQDELQSVADVREQVRTSHNVKTVTIGKDPLALVELVHILQRNEIVAMLIDRYTAESGVMTEFFGEPARFPIGPVLLAKSTGAAVIPAFVVQGSDGKYRAIADSIVPMEFGEDREEDIKSNIRKIVRVLERHIVEYVDQWYNFTYLWENPKSEGKEQCQSE